MTRPTHLEVNIDALRHNVKRVRHFAPGSPIIAMIKANAYGCGITKVVTALQSSIDAFGVTSLDEAVQVRQISPDCRCMVFHGVYKPDELSVLSSMNLDCVVHHARQVQWILSQPLPKPLNVWVKINTGMNRLGFPVYEVPDIVAALSACPWVQPEI